MSPEHCARGRPAGQLSDVWLRVSDKEFIVGNGGDLGKAGRPRASCCPGPSVRPREGCPNYREPGWGSSAHPAPEEV